MEISNVNGIGSAPLIRDSAPELSTNKVNFPPPASTARRAVEVLLIRMRLVEAQPILVEARERPVEEKEPQPNPDEGAGTGPLLGFQVIWKHYMYHHLRLGSPQISIYHAHVKGPEHSAAFSSS